MLSPGPGGEGKEGGVVTWSRGQGSVVTWSWGREVLLPGSGGEGGVVTWSQGGGERRCCDLVAHLPAPPPGVGQTDTCENITFARFATWAVIN